MIVKDVRGDRYSLRKTTMKSLDSVQFIVKFADIREYNGRSAQLFIGHEGPGHYIRVRIGKNNIGCRKFDNETMRLIRKAIKGDK